MAIAKRPVRNRGDIEKFIAAAGDKAKTKTAKPTKKAAPAPAKREPVLIRIPPDLLKRIDAAATKRGVSRAAWIVSVSSRALDEGGW